MRALRASRAAVLFAVLVPAAHAVPAGLEAKVYVDGMTFPVSMAVAGDGTLLVTEKSGKLRVVRGGVLDPTPVAAFQPYLDNEAGLGGMTLTPDFAQSRLAVVSYVPARDRDHIYLSRVRLLEHGGEIVDDPWLALPSRPGTNMHYSGIPRFGPDGRFYVSLGDLALPARSQDPSALSGSLLRYEGDLRIPADNPFGSGIASYAYGFRNPYGLDVGADGVIYIADNGGDHHDEVHRVVEAGNHGNSFVQGRCDGDPPGEPCDDSGRFVEPIYEFPETHGTTSVVAYHADLIPELRGDVLVGGWHGRGVARLRQSAADPGRFDALEPLFTLEGGRFTPRATEWWPETGVTDVKVAPDGAVLVLVAGFSAGAIYRIAPPAGPEPVGAEPPPGAEPVGAEPPDADGGPRDASVPDDARDAGGDVSASLPSHRPVPLGSRPRYAVTGGCSVARAPSGVSESGWAVLALGLTACRRARSSRRGRTAPRAGRRGTS